MMRRAGGLFLAFGAVGWLGCAEVPDSGTSPSAIEQGGGETVTQTSQELTCTKLRRGSGATVTDAVIAMDPLDPTRAGANLGTGILLNAGALATTTYQALLRFDLAPIPATANVSSATLTLNKYTNLGVGTVNVHRVLAPWSEATVTWSSFNGAFSSAIDGSVSSALPNGPVNVDLTAAVQAWLSGAQANEGLLLEQPGGGRTSFGASDASLLAGRPYLTVCYSLTPTCSDGVQNGSETGVDCGGSCAACPSCIPSAEVCNGADDDCDGLVDQGNPGGGGACATGLLGVCGAGTTACIGGALTCVQTGQASAESCNGQDDDCNGQTDELGTIACGVGACAATAPACVNGAPGTCSPAAPSAEICDGQADENCDGVIDDGCLCQNGQTQACYSGAAGTAGVGVCAAGTTTCVAGQWGACSGESLPSAELCNGADDDCNGVLDDGNPGGGLACTTGQPGVCSAGTTLCSAGAIVCAQTISASPELCDGVDNDCDGQVDEGNPGGGVACSTGLSGVCSAGTTVCSNGAVACAQLTVASAESCNGLDDDCDGQVDEGNPGGGVACSTGLLGACGTGATACSGGAVVCTQTTSPAAEACNGADDDCDGQVDELGTTACGVGACAATVTACVGGTPSTCTPGTPSAEICDGLFDEDCDGVVDNGCACLNGTVQSCYGGAPGTMGVGVCAAGTQTCVGGQWAACTGEVVPSAEACNGQDDDCDGLVDQGNPQGGASCSTGAPGACAAGTVTCASGALGCQALASPQSETCNGVDDDCDGATDEGVQTTFYQDADGDGAGNASVSVQACVAPAGYGAAAGDCNDASASVFPGAQETCNGGDDDCDGATDEGVTSTFYADVDGDGFGNGSVTTQACSAPFGFVGNANDCNDGSASVKPGGAEVCNGGDDDCDGQTDEGNPGGGVSCSTGSLGVCSAGTTACLAGAVTCMQTLQPTAEVCDNMDNDCDGQTDEGNPGGGTSCTTGLPGVCSAGTKACLSGSIQCLQQASATTEACDSLDNDCDGLVDDGVTTTYWQDADGDGFGNAAASIAACSQPSGYVTNSSDCNDTKFTVKPGGVEVCNGLDDNCNGQVDELVTFTYYLDGDGDGYGTGVTTQACSVPVGYAALTGDCNDANANVNPGKAEVCNNADDNCNGQSDEGDPGGGAQCATGLPGACSTGTYHCVSGAVACVQDTSQTWYLDGDDDGYGLTANKKTQCTQPAGYAALPNDCDDADEEINPGAVEVCNAVDDNCDNLVDNNVQNPTIWYFDGDGDGYGASPIAAQCAQPAGYSPSGGDCNDASAAVSPVAAESCNGQDDNCNSVIDEGNPGSGASCTTGLQGVCSAGTTACFGGGLICNQTNASGSEVCNSKDDDCDGQTDEGGVCLCQTGQTQSCYTGPAGTLGVGICAAGTQTCTAGVWGACQNQVQPGVENCALAPDEDCNGTAPSCSGSTLWAQKFGGSSSDPAYGIAVDASGNTYITGYFQGTVNFGGGSVTSAGVYDIFLVKLNSAGAYVWSKTFGGSSYDIGYDVAVDASGNVFLSGSFRSTTLNLGGSNLTNAGSTTYYDVFLAKFDSNGTHQWSKRFGGTNHDNGYALEVDNSGNVVLAGYFASTGSVTFGGSTWGTAGSYDPFVAKFDTNGNHLWSNKWGGSSADYAYDVAIGPSNEVILVGGYASTAMNFGGGTLAPAGSYDAYILKLDQNGNYVFAKKFGDSDTQYGYSVAVDGSGNILFTGIVQGGIDFGGGNITASGTYYDMFVGKLNSSGGYIFGKTFGATSTHDYAWGCAFDPAGNALVSGYFQGSVNFGGGTLTSAGSYDLAVIKLNTAGSHVYSKSFGNSSAQYGRRIKADASGNARWVGYFQGSVDFGLGTLTSAGSNDIFAAKLAP